MDVADIAAAIGVELVRRLAHGEGAGAYEVRQPDGTSAVLKVDLEGVLDFAHSSTFSEALRRRGYRVPASLEHGDVDGHAFELTDLAPGDAIEHISAAHLPQLLALNELQRDVDLPGREPWLNEMVTSLTEGRVGYCELDAIRAYDPALLNRLQAIAQSSRELTPPTRDVVHYDFSPYNLIADGDHVTGVIDWQGATSGDASFDLVTLAFYTYDGTLRDALLNAADRHTLPPALLLYAAHMTLRQVDWSLRHQNEMTARWHADIGTALLDSLTP